MIDTILRKGIDQASIGDNGVSNLGCKSHIQRLLGALAAADTQRSQEVLSNIIAYQKVGHSPQNMAPCLKDTIEATHLVPNPREGLFDTVYSIAKQFTGLAGQNEVAQAAMLAVGSLGRSSQIVFGTERRMNPLISKATVLLQQKYEQALEVDLTASTLHHQSKAKMRRAFERASDGMRDHVLASMRSLTR